MTRPKSAHPSRNEAFTLIELLTVVAIIGLLISIMMPSLGRARDQGKRIHCLARLKDFGNALAAYENDSEGALPPAEWHPDAAEDPELTYGWMEILFPYVYQETVYKSDEVAQVSFPVQRNVDADRWTGYFICKASRTRGVNSGNYRVYLPAWAAGTFTVDAEGVFDESSGPDPTASITRSAIRPKMLLIGDANEISERGDGDVGVAVPDDCSYIDAGEADYAGLDGQTGNRFSDRHSGGTNYLFQDFHGDWDTSLRRKLARDYDLNGIEDIPSAP
jgi:prepilin-type N-terminal cleavage/methylation domain-containing protein/prepilin-type processing-associated H-X9-DG protein